VVTPTLTLVGWMGARLRVGPGYLGGCAAWGWVESEFAPNCGVENDPLKFTKSPQTRPEGRSHGVRLILENSTVCHSRRISLLCPVFCGRDDHGIRISLVRQ
jgi:hypothetical protein